MAQATVQSGCRELARRVYLLAGAFPNLQNQLSLSAGTYSGVAREVAGYLAAGFTTFILDIPADEDELRHVSTVFRSALEGKRTGADS